VLVALQLWLPHHKALVQKKYPAPPGPSAWLENVGHFRTAQDGFGNDTKLENDRHLHHLQGCVPQRIDHIPGEQPGSRHNVAPRKYATLSDPDTLVREPKVVPRRKERSTFNGQTVRHLVRTSRLSIPIPGGDNDDDQTADCHRQCRHRQQAAPEIPPVKTGLPARTMPMMFVRYSTKGGRVLKLSWASPPRLLSRGHDDANGSKRRHQGPRRLRCLSGRKNARACIGKGSRGTGCCSLPPCKALQVTGRTSAWKDLEKKNNTARNG
jgi:hypothetical protein